MEQQPLRFDGRVAVITGAGNGLGRAYALLLGQRGARVVVNDVNKQAASDVVETIRNQVGGDAHVSLNSVETWEGAQKIAQDTIDTYGRIDILINNAGILRDASFLKMTDKQWNDVYKVHLFGTFALTRAVWNHMRDQRYGRIVMIASSSGLYGNFGQTNYGTAKTGILGLANTLSREGMSRNILVNTVAPIAASKMTADILPVDLLEALKPELVAPIVAYLCHETCQDTGKCYETGAGWCATLRWQRSSGAYIPLNRGITIEDVAHAWDKIDNWENPEYPASPQAAFGPIMKNLETLDVEAAEEESTTSQTLLPSLSGGKTGKSEVVDVPSTLGTQFSPIHHTYEPKEAILYALSVGMSKNPLDEQDLPYTYELNNTIGQLLVVPSFPVIWPNDLMTQITELSSFQFNPAMLLHGEHEVIVPDRLPSECTVLTRGKISHIFDKQKSSVVVFDTESVNKDTGEVLAYNRAKLLVRGVGGFGGDRGSLQAAYEKVPERKPDCSVKCPTEPNLALLYRLNGDKNPLHADPTMAAMAGFERPILHGLCSLGISARVLTQEMAPQCPENIRRLKGRFTRHVFPGETLVVEAWIDRENRCQDTKVFDDTEFVLFRCRIVERNNELVLDGGVAEIRNPRTNVEPKL